MVATALDAVPDDIGALSAALASAEDEAARAALVDAELALTRAAAVVGCASWVRISPRR